METYITIWKIDSQCEFALSQGTQPGALYQPRGVGWGRRWEGGSRGRGHMYTYGCIPMTYVYLCWGLIENKIL